MDSRKTFARQTLKSSAAAAVAFMAMAGAGAQDLTPINGNLPPGALPSSWDPAYNVCRGTDPKCYHDWVGAANRLNKVLIYTRTAGPRHASIGTALAAGLNPPLNANNVTQASLIAWLGALGIGADYTEDASVLGSANLNQYKAVVFVSNSRDAFQKHGTAANTAIASDVTNTVYADAAKTNLRQFVRAGGGFVAIHNAFGTEYNWPWYEGLLGNANYYSHGPEQTATMKLVGTADSSTAGLPATIPFMDEWYNLMPYPTKVKYLVTVDDSTYGTGPDTNHPGHGAFHPVAWCQYYDGGRAWLTTLGHDTLAWTDGSGFVGQAQFKQLILQGIQSAMGLTQFCKK
jgi:type 1 glutamine amidotransferase